ncbi:Glycosyl hydrolase family 35 [uncultured Paludibacter sp.]|nr:Glycosyl hydrolase family 35 [uncultured Paludibacter sp.]
MYIKNILIIFLLSFANLVFSQTIYTLDASRQKYPVIQSDYFKMGTNTNPEGKSVLVNNRYLKINGQPKILVMGELQYSRMDKNCWEDEILKMKAGGVDIIATYSFWNHHEEIEGQFDWSGNKDLRSFVKLCGKLGVYVYPRIGPWSHGEARNGGTPDWILNKNYIVDRSEDPVYKSYVERYFAQIGKQLQGLMFKDNGPIIGIQLENEYWKGKAGEPYMIWLKQTAIKNGLDVPLYTVTGWGESSVPAAEMIPLWGGYPDESWVPDIKKISERNNYSFSNFRDDPTIGNAQVKKEDGKNDNLIPYFTCEMGVGIFVSKHRRPIIGPIDGLGMVMAKVGSGANLLGYYIFAGASNPIGVYSSMEENKDETGYWSDLSPISYDFQAAIRESGLLNKSYFEIKNFNYFLNEFGDKLAPYEPVFATEKKDDFQYAARIKDNSGFLFGINYCRNCTTSKKANVRFSIKLNKETLIFPSKPIDISDSTMFVWPFNMNLGGVNLRYATAQPLYESKEYKTWVFVQSNDIEPEFSFDGKNILNVVSTNGKVEKKENGWFVYNLKTSKDCFITIEQNNGEKSQIIILSKNEGLYSWILNNNNQKHFFISTSTLYYRDNVLCAFDTIPNMIIQELNFEKSSFLKEMPLNQPERRVNCTVQPKGALEKAKWLVTSVKKVTPDNELYHKIFQKEFSSMNPALIKWAKLIIYCQSECKLRINENWCSQNIEPNKLNVLDVTGYVKKGENVLLMDFPVQEGEKKFAARLIVEYYNTERLDFTTDQSWLSSELYYLPAIYGKKPVYPLNLTTPLITAPLSEIINLSIPDFKEWTIHVPCDYMQGLNNLYLAMDYVGDIASLRLNNHLIADNINNNSTWTVNMKRNQSQMECADLSLEITPWQHIDKIYFDREVDNNDKGKSYIKSMRFIPEYIIKLKSE